jgi:Right handed beta helix region
LLLKKISIIAGLHFLLIGRLFAQEPAVVQGATRTAGGDGDGFDLDGGTSNSYLQHNYSHDNHGSGYCLFEYAGAAAHTGNTVRCNISENDSSGIEIWGANSGSVVSSDNIYGNIVSTGKGPQIYFANSNCNNISFAQNIIASSSGQSLISFGGSSGVSFADDDYWTGGAAFTILWGGKTYSSLSSWQAATGQDSGARSTNPSPFAGSPIFCWSISNH